MIDVNYHSFSPEQLTALVLKEAVISTEQELGKTVRNVILTVPAGFSTHARAALIRAANMTGVNVVALVDEPIAAAISYLKSKEAADKVKGKILILDMGAGTTDFFVFDYQDQKITPIMKDGIVNQGGNDYTEFTNLITTLYLDNMKRVRDDVEWFINKFDHKYADAPWKNAKDSLVRATLKDTGCKL